MYAASSSETSYISATLNVVTYRKAVFFIVNVLKTSNPTLHSEEIASISIQFRALRSHVYIKVRTVFDVPSSFYDLHFSRKYIFGAYLAETFACDKNLSIK